MNSTNEELGSFMAEMADVKPIQANDKVVTTKKPTETLAQKLKRRALEQEIKHDENGLSIDKVSPVDPHDYLSFKKDGVQEGVFKNLRLGKYQIDTHVMLNQLKFEDARHTLFQTLNDAHEKGIRTVLVQHGLGLNSKPFPAFLKSYVNEWLQQMSIVIAFHTALKQHGGLGAVYVLLKKHPNQKLINRERNRKG